MTTLANRTAGLVLSWASGSCNVDTFVALQVLELKAGKIHSESSGPCFSGSERDTQLLSASRLHRTQPVLPLSVNEPSPSNHYHALLQGFGERVQEADLHCGWLVLYHVFWKLLKEGNELKLREEKRNFYG